VASVDLRREANVDILRRDHNENASDQDHLSAFRKRPVRRNQPFVDVRPDGRNAECPGDHERDDRILWCLPDQQYRWLEVMDQFGSSAPQFFGSRRIDEAVVSPRNGGRNARRAARRQIRFRHATPDQQFSYPRPIHTSLTHTGFALHWLGTTTRCPRQLGTAARTPGRRGSRPVR
jgi:hypothetical protein